MFNFEYMLKIYPEIGKFLILILKNENYLYFIGTLSLAQLVLYPWLSWYFDPWLTKKVNLNCFGQPPAAELRGIVTLLQLLTCTVGAGKCGRDCPCCSNATYASCNTLRHARYALRSRDLQQNCGMNLYHRICTELCR